MKCFFKIVFYLTLVAPLNAYTANNWDSEKLKGKVKSFTSFAYEAKKHLGKIEKGKRVKYFLSNCKKEYNENGNTIEIFMYDIDGSIAEKYTYQYDEKENLIEEVIVSNAHSELNGKWTYTYTDTTKGDTLIKNKYEYNKKGKLIFVYTYKYDKKGNLIEEEIMRYELFQYVGEDTSNEKHTYTYNSKNKRIERNTYRSNSLTKKNIYKYNKKGNLIEIATYSSMGKISFKNIYKHWANKINIFEIDYNRKDEPIYNGYYQFNKMSDLIKYKSKSTPESLKYKYKYDEKGNWVKRINFVNGVPESIIERKYEYFE